MTDKRRLTVLVTRPRGEAEAFAAVLAERGHDAVQAPLLDIVLDETARIDLGGVRAVLFTSANGVRAWARLGAPCESEAFCVGDATAQAARDAGFALVHSAGGDVAALAGLVRSKLSPLDGALLHAAGSALAGDLSGDLAKDGYEVRRVQLYRQDVATTLPFAAVQALRDARIDAVTFFSPRTAETFVRLAKQADLLGALAGTRALALSQAALDVAREEGAIWNSAHAAAVPTESALLDALDDLARMQDPTPPPPPPPKPAPAATPPAAKRSSAPAAFATALVVAMLAALAFVYWQTTMTGGAADPGPALRALEARLTQVDRRLAGLENRPVPQAPPAPVVDLSGVEGRLAALEARPAADPRVATEIAQLAEDNQRLRVLLESAIGEARVIRDGGERDRAGARRAEFLLAVGQLRDAALAGRGFADELRVARGLAPDGAAPAIAQLAAQQAGVETRASLARRFAPIANAVVAAGRIEEAADRPWLAEALERAQRYFSIRRVGEVEGDSPSARVARAEARLAVDDLAGALAALDPPGPAWLAPAQNWMEAARARLALEAALARLASGG
ncbi:MAG: uroporphyrinogen-III synthase [Tagaea sp.]|nr:uroporphyrinogen-III synthase [Tagaea sp.]